MPGGLFEEKPPAPQNLFVEAPLSDLDMGRKGELLQGGLERVREDLSLKGPLSTFHQITVCAVKAEYIGVSALTRKAELCHLRVLRRLRF